MELPELLEKISPKTEKAKEEYLLAVQVWDEGVKSAIWTVAEEKTKVMALGSTEFWEGGEEELAIAVDKSLASAFQSFVIEGEEPSKVVLGLPENWSSEAKIKPEKLTLVQYFCDKLELKAVGFVSTFDALNHHLEDVEGIPGTVILINPWKKLVNIALVEAGKIRGVETVVRSENLGADVYEGLLHFEDLDSLPSRMLLFNGQDMEDARQILTSFPWQTSPGENKKLPFFHLPKIEILPYGFDITAIALSGGKEVAKSLGMTVTAVNSVMPESEETVSAKEEETPFLVSEPVEKAGFGFIKGKDITEGQDLANEIEPEAPIEATQEEVKEEIKTAFSQFKPEVFSEPITPPEKTKRNFTLPSLPSFSIPALPGFSKKGPLVLVVIILLLFLLGGGVFAYGWYVPKATVVLYVQPQTQEKEFNLVIDPNQEAVDIENNILPGTLLESSVTGEDLAQTTGEKTIGEKSKGSVTLFNRTDSRKVFPAGVILVGPGNLKFSLDLETTVASKTPDLSSGVDKWGESKTEVTAVDIGAQYNLAASSQFSLSGQPLASFLAKNESAFSGGSSRQIQAVSSSDQKNLTDKLTLSLIERGKSELSVSVPEGSSLIPESVTGKAESTNFDYKVGEEAQALSLKLNLLTSGVVYKNEDLASLIGQLMTSSIPNGYSFKKEETTTRFELVKKNTDGSLEFKVYVKTNLLPKIEIADILKNIKGKYPNVAKSYLSTLGGYADSQIVITPQLPGFLGALPRQEQKISLEVRSQ